MGREALHGALRELISVAVLWYEDDLLASDQGDAVNVVHGVLLGGRQYRAAYDLWNLRDHRSEEHTSELQSLMRISYAVFCLKKKKRTRTMLKTDYNKIKMTNITHK